MNTPSDLWHTLASLLFLTLVSSTIILSAAWLLGRYVTELSASLRCRIWMLSLLACFVPAIMMATASITSHIVAPQFGTPSATEVVASRVQQEIELPRQADENNLSAKEQAVANRSVPSEPTERDTIPSLHVANTARSESEAVEISEVANTSGLVTLAQTRDVEVSSLSRPLQLSVELCRIVVIIWISIAAILTVRLFANVIRSTLVWRSRFRDSAQGDAAARQLTIACKAIDADAGGVAIRTNDAIVVPLVIGLFRPVIVLPTEAIAWPTSQLKLVLQHELAHVHRGDIAWNCLASLIRAIIWFQPLAWIVQRQLREDQEIACDDAVLLLGSDAREYAKLLIHIAESVLQRRQCLVSIVSMANSHRVERRIRSILDASANRQESWRQRFAYLSGVALALLLIVICSLTWTPKLALAAQDEKPAARPKIAVGIETPQPAIDEKAPESRVSDDVYKFKHRVVDKTGAGAAGATVTIHCRNFTVAPAITDAEGWCELTVPAGSESAPTTFLMRTVAASGEEIGFGNYQLKGTRLLVIGPATLMPTCLQKVQVNDSHQNPVPDAIVGTALGGSIIGVSKTDASGAAFVRRLPQGDQVFSLKDDAGFDFQKLSSLDISTGETEEITLTLEGARPIKVRFVTTKDFARSKSKGDLTDNASYADQFVEQVEPLASTYFVPTYLRRPDGGFWTGRFLDSEFMDAICPKTNAAGETTIRWMPTWQSGELDFQVTGKQFAPIQQRFLLDDADKLMEVKFDRLVEIHGRVLDQDGKPVKSAAVKGTGLPWDDGRYGAQYQSAVQDGTFSMFVAPRQDLLLLAEIPGQVSRTSLRAVLPLKSPLNVELSFRGSNRISGLLTSGPDRTPLADRVIEIVHVSRGEDFSDFIKEERRSWGLMIETKVRTDKHGRYSLQVGDGEWQLLNPFDNRERNSAAVNGGFQVQKDFHSDDKTLLRTTIISAATQKKEPGTVSISGVSGFPGNSEAGLVSRTPHLIEARSQSGLAFTVWDGQSDDFQISVAPVVTAHGQLVDDNGSPLPNRSIRFMILPSVPDGAKLTKKYDYGNSGQISTDEQGKFTLTNFIQGCECQIMATNDEDKEWAKKHWHILKSVVPMSNEAIDLGSLPLSSIMPDVR